MDKKNYDIVLKMEGKNVIEINNIVSRDTEGNIINFTLMQDDEPYAITGSSVSLYFCNSKGQVFVQEDVTVTNANIGQFTLTLKSDVIFESGLVMAEVVLTNGEQIDTSQAFTFKVRQAIANETGYVPIVDVPNYRQDIAVMQNNLNNTITELRDTASTINNKIDSVDERLDQKIDSTNNNLSGKINDVNSNINNKIDSVDKINDTNLQAHKDSNAAHQASNITYTGAINQSNVKDALDSTQEQINAMTVGGTEVDPRLSQALVDAENKRWDNFKSEMDSWQNRTKTNEDKINTPETVEWSNSAQSICSMNVTGMLPKGLFSPLPQGVEPWNNLVDMDVIRTAITTDSKTLVKDTDRTLNINSCLSLTTSTEYTILLNVTAMSNFYNEDTGFKMQFTGGLGNTVSLQNGINKFKFTHTSIDTGMYFYIDATEADSATVEFSRDIMILEGDYTDTELHFVDDFATCALSYDLVMQNPEQLFNGEYLNGYLNAASSSFVEADGFRTTKPIACFPNTIYSISANVNKKAWCSLDASGNIFDIITTEHYTTTSNAKYLQVYYQKDENGIVEGITIAKGDEAIANIPYDYSKTEISYPPQHPGVKLQSGANNVVNAKTGDLDVEVKKYVLTSEDINSTITNLEHIDIYFVKPLDNQAIFIDGNGDKLSSDKFTPVDYSSVMEGTYGIYGRVSTQRIGLIVPKDTYTTLEEAQSDLVGTEIYYEIAKPFSIPNGQQGYKCPGQLFAWLNGDLIVVGKLDKTFTVTNTNVITLGDKEKCISITGINCGVFAIQGGKYVKLDATLTDSTHITLDASIEGTQEIYVKAQLDKSMYLDVEVNGDIPINMGANVAALNEAVSNLGGDIQGIQNQVVLLIAKTI